MNAASVSIRIARDAFERIEIDLRQRIFEPFPLPAEPIVRQHGDDGTDIVTAGATDGDLRTGGHDIFR